MLLHSPMKKDHPETWSRYLNNQTVKVSARKGITVTVDLSPADLMCLVTYLEDEEMVQTKANFAAHQAIQSIYSKIRGSLQSAEAVV